MLIKRGLSPSKFKKLYQGQYPQTLRLLIKPRLTRYEICAIFILTIETLLKGEEIFELAEEKLREVAQERQKLVPIKSSSKCPVCLSPYRWQYELYYLSSNKNLEWVLSATRFLDENQISLRHLKNHFQKHFNPQFDISRSSQKSLKEIVLKEGPDFVENILSHFLITNELLEKIEERISRSIEEGKEISSSDANLLKSLLLTLLRYASWIRDFSKKEDEEVENLGKLFPFEI